MPGRPSWSPSYTPHPNSRRLCASKLGNIPKPDLEYLEWVRVRREAKVVAEGVRPSPCGWCVPPCRTGQTGASRWLQKSHSEPAPFSPELDQSTAFLNIRFRNTLNPGRSPRQRPCPRQCPPGCGETEPGSAARQAARGTAGGRRCASPSLGAWTGRGGERERERGRKRRRRRSRSRGRGSLLNHLRRSQPPRTP